MFQREGDAGILAAAQGYIELQSKAEELLANVEDRLLSGSPGTIYFKRLGHRPLTVADFKNIVMAKGTPEDKQAMIAFTQAQTAIRDR